MHIRSPESQRASERYRRTQFATASTVEQRIFLLDAAVRECRSAAAAIRAGDRARAHTAAAHGRRLLLELAVSVRRDALPELADLLMRLSVYLHGRLISAVVSSDPAAAEEVAAHLEGERDAWKAARRGSSESG